MKRNDTKDRNNVLIGCGILILLGVFNIATSFFIKQPMVYYNHEKLALEIEENLEVEVQSFYEMLSSKGKLEAQQVTMLQNMMGSKQEENKQLRMPLGGLCEQLGLAYQWDEENGVFQIGEVGKQAQEIPVLMYHHLLPEEDIVGVFARNNIVVSVEDFQAHMEYLAQAGYHTVSLFQLYEYVKGEILLPEKSVVITFDDGYLSNYEYAFPIMKSYDFRGVIFLLTAFTQQESQQFQPKALQYLSWDEIEQMRKTFEFASHSHDMHRLDSMGRGILASAGNEEIVSDLNQSRQFLNNSPYYAYPYGHYSGNTKIVLQQQGVRLAFTVAQGNVKAGDDRLELKRWDMAQYSQLEQFQSIFE